MAIRIVLGVAKNDLAEHEELGKMLSSLSDKVKELEKACLYAPKAGNLSEMLRLLDDLKINYTVHTSINILSN